MVAGVVLGDVVESHTVVLLYAECLGEMSRRRGHAQFQLKYGNLAHFVAADGEVLIRTVNCPGSALDPVVVEPPGADGCQSDSLSNRHNGYWQFLITEVGQDSLPEGVVRNRRELGLVAVDG